MRAERPALALFARAPVAGRAKTRLIPALGAEGAAALYRAFLHDCIAKAEQLEAQTRVWAASEDDRAWLEGELARPVQPQPPGDLGARIEGALRDGIDRTGRALVLGSDAPTIPLGHLRSALAALDRADLVLGPAADGGFWVIGARAPLPLGTGVRWSSRHTLADTLARARGAGLTIELVAPWYDVDTPADLELLRVHLALRPGAARHTAAALRALRF